jgi:hypothetical protein
VVSSAKQRITGGCCCTDNSVIDIPYCYVPLNLPWLPLAASRGCLAAVGGVGDAVSEAQLVVVLQQCAAQAAATRLRPGWPPQLAAAEVGSAGAGGTPAQAATGAGGVLEATGSCWTGTHPGREAVIKPARVQ